MVVGGKGGGATSAGREGITLAPVPEDSTELVVSSLPSGTKGLGTTPNNKVSAPGVSGGGGVRSEVAPPTPDPLDYKYSIGRCVTCGNPTNEFSEEVVALCAVAVGMYCSRLPHMVPHYLVSRIIPAIVK